MSDIPAPNQSLAVIGHEAAKRQIEAAYASGRMHHAWLITGEAGIGKATFAMHIAHMILSGGENKFGRFNPEHQAARLIMSEAHPDLFVLRRPYDDKARRFKDVIPVEDARKLGPFLSMTASYGHGRVALIDEAHTLNRNGQNAILKMIEEPPTGATILLTATTVGALLPTIRSRCRVLKLDPLSNSELDVVLARLSIDVPEDQPKDKLYQAAHGSIGRALSLIQTNVLPLYQEILTILTAMPTLDLVRVHKLADGIGRKDESETYLALTSLVVDTLREAVLCAAQGKSDPTGLAVKMAGSGRLDKALDIWDNTRQTFAMTESASLDRKLALINALSAISREMA
ncbi:MAG: DNA polymerase III subunit delta' [Alphaproteobacteria bacterium]|nr:DNA polymerase III subunit delta' [Alphaproteobacteria bacterium]